MVDRRQPGVGNRPPGRAEREPAVSAICTCGHHRADHTYGEDCLRFLCCTRRRNLTPGRRHTEHDGINHATQSCACTTFTQEAEND
jgi:hypothetical protein